MLICVAVSQQTAPAHRLGGTQQALLSGQQARRLPLQRLLRGRTKLHLARLHAQHPAHAECGRGMAHKRGGRSAQGHAHDVATAAFSPDGATIATGADDNKVRAQPASPHRARSAAAAVLRG